MKNIVAKSARSPARFIRSVSVAITAWALAAALSASFAAAQAPAKSSAGFKLETTAFKPGGDIPAKFTCDGEDVSPALTWTNPPAGTKGFALIVDDPDAPGGTFTHWIVVGIRAEGRALPEGVNKTGNVFSVRGGGKQNTNDFGRVGYNGPCPPPGKPHRYFFRLYALDSPLTFHGPGNADTIKALVEAMKGHILAKAELMGKYQR